MNQTSHTPNAVLPLLHKCCHSPKRPGKEVGPTAKECPFSSHTGASHPHPFKRWRVQAKSSSISSPSASVLPQILTARSPVWRQAWWRPGALGPRPWFLFYFTKTSSPGLLVTTEQCRTILKQSNRSNLPECEV